MKYYPLLVTSFPVYMVTPTPLFWLNYNYSEYFQVSFTVRVKALKH